MFREYADEAMKQGKVFKDVAREKFDEVAAETIKSRLFERKNVENEENFLLN
jgi:hypothetical protein